MDAGELMVDTIPFLRMTDTGDKALEWMDEFKVCHLPIVDNGEYVGLISDNEILSEDLYDKTFGEIKRSYAIPHIFNNQHIYDVIKIAEGLKLTAIPVLSEEKKYLGVITLKDLVHSLADITSAQNPGGVIVLELNSNDYVLSEIARIIESNDAKILSLYVSSVEDSSKIELNIKVNRTELTSIIKTFERYDYNIKRSFHENVYGDDLKHRYNMLIKYLDM